MASNYFCEFPARVLTVFSVTVPVVSSKKTLRHGAYDTFLLDTVGVNKAKHKWSSCTRVEMGGIVEAVSMVACGSIASPHNKIRKMMHRYVYERKKNQERKSSNSIQDPALEGTSVPFPLQKPSLLK